MRKKLKQESLPKLLLLLPPPSLRLVTFMGTIFEALFRIGFISWFFMATSSSYPRIGVAPYDETGSQVLVGISLQSHLINALN